MLLVNMAKCSLSFCSLVDHLADPLSRSILSRVEPSLKERETSLSKPSRNVPKSSASRFFSCSPSSKRSMDSPSGLWASTTEPPKPSSQTTSSRFVSPHNLVLLLAARLCRNTQLQSPISLHYSQMFTIYIAKATANFGLPATRPIYQRAIEVSTLR